MKTKVILLLIMSLAIGTSCHEEKEDKISETAEFIRGTYRLKSITWEGDPVDLNNDGVQSNDFCDELLSLSGNNRSWWRGSASGDAWGARVGLEMPYQRVRKDVNGNYKENSMNGGVWTISLSGKINQDGTVEILFDRFRVDEFDPVDLQKMHDGSVIFDMTGKGCYYFRLHAAFYDRLTHKLVEGINPSIT